MIKAYNKITKNDTKMNIKDKKHYNKSYINIKKL